MPERTQLNINIKPDLLKKLKKVALENNRKLVELINEVLSNYISDIKNDQINYFELECLRSAFMIDLGLGFKMSNKVSSFTLIIQKEIF